MSKRTTWVLAAIALAMLVFIVVVEQHSLSTGELESRRGQVLDRFVRARVTELTLVRGDETIAHLVRDEGAEETLDTFDVGSWRVTEPVEGAADSDAVDALLQACEVASARRTLERVSASDRAQFGLAEPRFTLTFRVADEVHTLRVGGDDSTVDGTFVEVDESGTVHIVGRDFVEALDQDTDHFRSKELAPELRVPDVTRIVVRAGGVDTTLEPHGGRWIARTPFEGWVRRGSIDGLFDVLLDARVARFVHDGADALVASPEVRVQVDSSHEGAARASTWLIGAPCSASDGEAATRAVRVDDGPVVCVLESALSGALGLGSNLRETRLMASPDEQIERIDFERGGETRLSVRRDGSEWKLVEGPGERAADENAVAEYARALRGTEAESFLPADDVALAAHGLDHPVARLVIHRSDESFEETIDVGTSDTVGVWIRRGDEPSIARFVGDLDELLGPSALRFRTREVLHREADDANSLVLERAGATEELAAENGTWRVTAPVALAADRIATRELIQALASLHAVRWVSDDVLPEHGLATPRLRVRIGFAAPEPEHEHEHDEGDDHDAPAGPATVTLVVGGATDGGAFARVDEVGGVFVIASEIVERLETPLADRELVAIDATLAESVHVVAGTTTLDIQRVDGDWRVGERVVDAEAMVSFFDRLRSLRASRAVRYGEGAIAAPAWSIELRGASGPPVRLEVASPTGDVALARHAGVPVEFAISADTARALAEFRP